LFNSRSGYALRRLLDSSAVSAPESRVELLRLTDGRVDIMIRGEKSRYKPLGCVLEELSLLMNDLREE
jgi:hypothetical protein